MSFAVSGKAVILNSRQSLYPCGSDPWIVASNNALEDIEAKGLNLLASVGTPAWEIVLYLASIKDIPMTVIISRKPGESIEQAKEQYCSEFRLDRDNVKWRDIEAHPGSQDRPGFQSERDHRIMDMADVIYPVSVRPHGNLEKILANQCDGDKIINRVYEVRWGTSRIKRPVSISRDAFAFNIDVNFENHIIHWTRSVHAPWPGETRHDYYDAIVQSDKEYPRSALHTLIRILNEKRLRSSQRHMQAGVSAVSFSSLPPSRAATLMRWRARYREMSFEPYGIAINQSAAERVGIKKAIYGNREMIVYLNEEERPYFQSLGTIGDWEQEREYRHLGDLDLNSFSESEIKVIVKLPSAIEKVKAVFGGDVVSLLKI